MSKRTEGVAEATERKTTIVSATVDSELHLKVKHKLLDSGKGMRDLIRLALQSFLDGKLEF